MTAEQVVDKYPMEKDFWSFTLSRESAIEAAKEYSELQNKELSERVKKLEAILGETYDPKKYNDGFLQWIDKYFAVKPRVQWFLSMSTGKRSTIKEIERQYERAMLESPLIKSI